MIFDGQWKKELNRQACAIEFWSKRRSSSNRVIHHLNRAILYSAIVIRKAMEDEREAEMISVTKNFSRPRLKILNSELCVEQFPYANFDKWFARGNVFASDYEKGKTISVQAQEVCNQIIHSYMWTLVNTKGQKGYEGFLIASDRKKEKCVFCISFDEWKRLIKIAVDSGSF